MEETEHHLRKLSSRSVSRSGRRISHLLSLPLLLAISFCGVHNSGFVCVSVTLAVCREMAHTRSIKGKLCGRGA